MRTLTICCILLAFGAVLAQPANAQRPERKKTRAKMLERFDKNGDGRLDKEERAAARGAARKMREKRRGGDAKRGDRPRRQSREQLMKRFDANGNGKLEPAERRRMAAAIRKFRQERRLGPPGSDGPRRGAGRARRGPRGEGGVTDRRADRPERRGATRRGRARGPEAEGRRPDRPRTDRPRTDRPRTDRPRTDRPRADRPRADRPRTDRPGARAGKSNRRAQIMKWFDRNKDGRLDKEERQALMKVLSQPRRRRAEKL